jgi:hypothetical protein
MKTNRLFGFLLFLFAFSLLPCTAQVPQGFNYQAIARDGSGIVIANQTIPVEITIQTTLTGGTIIYKELFSSISSNQFGLISLVVGTGAQTGGSAVSFSAIDWSSQTFFLKTAVQYPGTTWTTMGTSQVWSVPYSLQAKNVGPLSKLGITGTTSDMEEALFEVKNKVGNTVFAVYNEGVRAYVGNGDAKGIKGGFSVGGYDGTKGIHDLLWVTSDSVRVYVDSNPLTKGVRGGFSVGGYDMTKSGKLQNYLDVSKDSVRVYIDSNPATKGIKGGFSVGGYDMTKGTNDNYLNVNTDASGIINPSQNRILWYPLKNAFLTGRVLAEKPDSVGVNSFASGYESKAKGQYSQALGYQAVARGNYSTSIGYQSEANKDNSFAFGQWALARNQESYAFGRGAIASGFRSFAFGSAGVDTSGTTTGVTYAKGDYSFAIGQGSQAFGHGAFSFGLADAAKGDYSVAMGYKTSALGDYSSAMGWGTTAIGLNSTTIGYYATAIGNYSTSIGTFTSASGYNSTSIGNGNKAGGAYSTAMGILTIANGDISTAMGNETTASGGSSTALGMNTIASGNISTAMGYETTAAGEASTAMGWQTNANGKNSTALGTNTIASKDYSIAMGAETNANGNYSTAMGYKTTANGIYSTSTGYKTIAGGDYSTAMGNTATASGDYSTAMGWGTTAIGLNASVIGYYSTANGDYSTSIGTFSKANGYNSTAMGNGTMASGYYSTAMGLITIASGDVSTALGSQTYATGSYSTAIGHGTVARGSNSTAMGYTTIASGEASTAIGWYTKAKPYASLVIGQYNDSTCSSGGSSVWTNTDPVFIIGNGTSTDARGNALTVLKNGCVGLQSVISPTYALQLPNNSTVSVGSGRAYAWTTYSDNRLKENQMPLSYGLSEVMELCPKQYVHHSSINQSTWAEENIPRTIGLIAQDVYKIIPEAVDVPENSSTGLWGLNYDKLIPVLIKALQEQQYQIESFKSENSYLKSQLRSLQEKVDKIETLLIKSGLDN